jgi:hypothetical protein
MNKLKVPLKYIGIPFKENGSDLTGINCLHLAKRYVEDELSVKVTELPPDIQKAQQNSDRYRSLLEPIFFKDLIPGDVPFFSFPGERWHCGVYLGYGDILHTTRPALPNGKSRSLISHLSPKWEKFYLGAIRTKGKKEIIVPNAEGVVGLIIAIVSFIFSLVSSLTAPRPSFGNDSGSPKYGFDALDNTISNELIYPLGFGYNKYAGNIIWQKDEGAIIKRIIILGFGPINSVSDVRINDIPIAELPGCSYTAYLGTPGQNVDSRASSEVYGLRNVAYIALTLQSSEKLPGGNPTVTCYYEGFLMPTWNGSAWTGATYSRNPAACCRKLLLIPRYRGGGGASESEIDDISFGECYDQSAASIDNGEGGTHARHQFDFVFDAEKPFVDALQEILNPYGMFLVVGEKISLRMLKEESAVYAFDEDNILPDSFKYYQIPKNDSYNLVKVKYTDPDQNDVRVDAESRDQADMIRTGTERRGEFAFLGISRFAEASRRAEFIKNESNVNIWMAEMDVDIDSLHCTVGDVITLTHSLPGWTDKPFRILKIDEEEDFKRHLTLKEENATIYNDAFGSVIEKYDYGSPPNSYDPVDEVTGLIISESTYYLHKDGTAGSDILISWTAPAGASKQFLKEYQLELKKGAGDYAPAGTASSSKTSFIIPAVEDEITYYVRVKTVNFNGVVSDGATSSSLTVLGKLQSPSTPTGFDVSQQGSNLRFSCDPSPDPDFAFFRMKKGSEWSMGDTIAERADITEYFYPVGEIGPQVFMIKAVDRSGLESDVPAIDTLTVIPPPDMNFVNTFDRWSMPLEFKLSNLSLIQANYHDAGYVRPCLAIKTAVTWEDREAEAKTWEQQEADGGLLLNSTKESSGYAEMARPYDIGTIIEFKIVADADYRNVTGGTVTIQVSYSEDAVTYSSFADVDPVITYRARYLKFKIILAVSDTAYNIYLYDLLLYINAPSVKKAWFKDVLIPIIGLKLTFDAGFTVAPRISHSIVNGVVGLVIFNNKTKDDVDVMVYDPATKAAIGTAEIDAEAVSY